MQQNLCKDALRPVTWLLGDAEIAAHMPAIPAKKPFEANVLEFLNEVSRRLMRDPRSRAYSDVVTLAFWLRKASTLKLRERFDRENDACLRLGRGVAFHIAPSNVPVNFAYSLAAGLLTGNANIVRVPSKEFMQVTVIADALRGTMDAMPEMRPYALLVQYEHEKTINDVFSAIADTRIVWGGDATVREIRKSPLAPRAGEVTFSDRFSIAVIDSESYLTMDEQEKERAAEGFYNDTYLTDQNACTSPRLVAWMGSRKEEAKDLFWGRLHELVKRKYHFQSIQGVDKLAGSCLAAVTYGARKEDDHSLDSMKYGLTTVCMGNSNIFGKVKSGVTVEPHTDNLLVRVKVPWILDGLMELKGNSGYFLEYDCRDIMELKKLCSNSRCQTVAYIGDVGMVKPLLTSGIRGIDRVVPVGRTMDFDLIWDGYNLYERLTRMIMIG